MPKDAFGVKLQVGLQVVTKIGSEMVIGIVNNIDEGISHLAGPQGSPQVKPGFVTVVVPVKIPFDPTNPRVGNIVITSGQPQQVNAHEAARPEGFDIV
jgi:hypothetical protein